jgi:hypothetical protein
MAISTATKRKLVLKMSVSLDGFVGGPNGEVDWIFRTMGGDSTEWIVNALRRRAAGDLSSRTMPGSPPPFVHTSKHLAVIQSERSL